jgi:quercetin dioxygenase-like cupin family protein
MSLRVRKLSEEPGVDEREEGFSGVNTVWAVLKRTDLTGFSSRIFRMEAGGHTATHAHDREHVAVVISGTCKAESGGDTKIVKVGSIITVPRGLSHRFSNPGPGRLVLLIMNLFTDPGTPEAEATMES